jgi:hypothetical protein
LLTKISIIATIVLAYNKASLSLVMIMSESSSNDSDLSLDSSSDDEPTAKRVRSVHPWFDPQKKFEIRVNKLEMSEFENNLKNNDNLCWRGGHKAHDDDVKAQKACVQAPPTALTLAAAEAVEAALAMHKEDKKMNIKRKLSLLKIDLAASASAITTILQTDGKISNDRAERARKYQAQLENGRGCLRSVLCDHCGCRLLNPDPSIYTGGYDEEPSNFFYCCPGCAVFGKTIIRI